MVVQDRNFYCKLKRNVTQKDIKTSMKIKQFNQLAILLNNEKKRVHTEDNVIIESMK